MKRKALLTDSIRDKSLKKEKRQVTLATFNKWQLQFDRNYNSLSWLRCETNDNTLVEKLWCHACRKYESSITGMKNFSSTWIKGSTNQKTSNVVDHATSEQHTTLSYGANASRQRQSFKGTVCPLCTYCKMFFQNGYCYKRKAEEKV